MTLAEIEALWAQAPSRLEVETQGSEERVLEARWRQVVGAFHEESPWLRAMRTAVGSQSGDLCRAWLSQASQGCRALFSHANRKAVGPMIRAHMKCAEILCERASWTHENPDEVLRPALTVAPDHVCLGFLRDLARFLGNGVLRWPPRTPLGTSQPIGALLTDESNEGVAATLTLELMPEGSGAVYPAPSVSLLPDGEFRQAIENGRLYVRSLEPQWGAGNKQWDVRWSLQRRGDETALDPLTGPSLGGACALALAKLVLSA